jgi:hypothetical protein
MIAAFYANTNLDSEENDRPKRIQELEGHFNKAIEIIYNDGVDPDEKEIDWNNPFWAAARRAYDRKLEKLRGERGESTVAYAVGDDGAATLKDRKREVDQVAS